ncbi:MAG: hypothetical protein KDC90_07785, partial [Ignavibacteriae bacterium]|nr:hypothetical protein [Ignavibacteriota bacterium]
MKNFIQLLAVLLLLSFSIYAQEIRWQESFETDGEGTRYTTSSFFYIGPNDHCRRTDGSDISNESTFDHSSYSNIDGTYFWAAEDVDSGGDSLDEKSILFNPINITGLTGLTFKGLFGADGNASGLGFWPFNYADYIFLDYSMNGGASFSFGLAFRHSSPPGFEPLTGPLRQDADLNGFGEGTILVPSLIEYSFDIPNGSSV